ncbi:MAG: hypothetical protein SNH27_13855 [Rikenellaceae bacterium]
MKLERSLLEQANDLLNANQESIAKTEVPSSVSWSCSGCGAGCSGIVGD